MRATPSPPSVDSEYLAGLVSIASHHGIDPVGVCDARVLERARAEIDRRRAVGMDNGLHFTFKNPARSTDPQRAVTGARSIFVGARAYDSDEPSPPTTPSGRVAKYAWMDHYEPLREGLRAVAGQLRGDGFRAVAFADDNSIVDREVAYKAGIGWFGKNANILVPGAGSWFVLGCVITTAPLPINGDPATDGCGTCHRCLDACPTGAIVAPGVIDARRCLAWILQKPGAIDPRWREAIGDRIYGCDDCQTVCPPNVRFAGRRAPLPNERLEAWVSLIEVLEASDDELLRRWGRWYIADRDPRWVRRNALVALGNTADPGDPAVHRCLERYVGHDDPVLRDHATWAAQRLGQQARR